MNNREAAITPPDARRSLWVAMLIGFGIMAAIDEIVFHQVLAWHHFYDRSTSDPPCCRTACCTPPSW